MTRTVRATAPVMPASQRNVPSLLAMLSPALPRRLLPAARRAPRVQERAPEQELDLTVQAPQLVVGPLLEGREQLRVHPEQEWLSLGGHLGLSGEGFRR